MQYINLTPHTVSILDADGGTVAEYPASGQVARLATEVIGSVGDTHTVRYGELNGLPRQAKDTRYVVSLVCLLALQGTREDVLAPWQEVRNDVGRIIGCRGLHRLADSTGARYEVNGCDYGSCEQAQRAALADAENGHGDGFQTPINEIPRA